MYLFLKPIIWPFICCNKQRFINTALYKDKIHVEKYANIWLYLHSTDISGKCKWMFPIYLHNFATRLGFLKLVHFHYISEMNKSQLNWWLLCTMKVCYTFANCLFDLHWFVHNIKIFQTLQIHFKHVYNGAKHCFDFTFREYVKTYQMDEFANQCMGHQVIWNIHSDVYSQSFWALHCRHFLFLTCYFQQCYSCHRFNV